MIFVVAAKLMCFGQQFE
jgi:hypothetical protein